MGSHFVIYYFFLIYDIKKLFQLYSFTLYSFVFIKVLDLIMNCFSYIHRIKKLFHLQEIYTYIFKEFTY